MRLTKRGLIGVTILAAVFLAAFGVAMATSHFVQVSQEKESGEIVKGYTVLPEDQIALWTTPEKQIALWTTPEKDEPVESVPFVTWETDDPLRDFTVTSAPVVYFENLTGLRQTIDPVSLRPVMPCGWVEDENGEKAGFVGAEMWNEDGDHMGTTCDDHWDTEDQVLKAGDMWKMKIHLFRDGPPRHEDGPSRHDDGPSDHEDGPSDHHDGPSDHEDGPSGHEDGPSGHEDGRPLRTRGRTLRTRGRTLRP